MASYSSPRAEFEEYPHVDLRLGPTSSNDLVEQKIKPTKREKYSFKAQWLISSLAWSNEPDTALRIALSSYIEKYENRIHIVQLDRDEYDQELHTISEFEHPYPATKILWVPNQSPFDTRQLLATSADYLRIWRTSLSGETKLECLLHNNNQGPSKLCAPLTSFDWNDTDPSLIVTSSVDTTCTIWDIETKTPVGNSCDASIRTQILAHEQPVYDVSFSKYGSGKDVFVSCSGDGTVKLFDLRRLNSSSILYEDNLSDTRRPIVRVSCSKRDPYLVATFALDSRQIILLDIRNPEQPLDATMNNHCDSLNGISWAPHSAKHLCSGANDGQALIWDLNKTNQTDNVTEPLLSYQAGGKINSISWAQQHPEWIAISYLNNLELLRV